MSDEPRTLRALRLAIRDLEADLARLHMSPATAIGYTFGDHYLHKARTALRQAERHFAGAGDGRLQGLADRIMELAGDAGRDYRQRLANLQRYGGER